MAKVPNGVEKMPTFITALVGWTSVTDRHTTDRRQTTDRRTGNSKQRTWTWVHVR